jgi:hypothetical protein
MGMKCLRVEYITLRAVQVKKRFPVLYMTVLCMRVF